MLAIGKQDDCIKFLFIPNKRVLSKVPQKRKVKNLIMGNQHNLRIRIHGKSVVVFCGTLQLVNLKQN